MRVKIDISRDKFDQIGSNESKIIFNVPDKLQDIVSFECWGFAIVYSLFENRLEEIPGLTQVDDLYIAGKATITLNKVVGGNFSVALYDISKKEWQRNSNGEIKYIKKHWPYVEEVGTQFYGFNGVLDSPPGSIDMNFAILGDVTLEFNTEDCILLSEYCENPRFYQMKKNDL